MYQGKTVLITGVSRGIGLELAKHFRLYGACVIGISRDWPNDRYVGDWHKCDLSNPHDILDLFPSIKESRGSIDICINNAAVLTSQYALRMPVEKAAEMVTTDLLAPFIVARESAKLMTNSYGRIINISSMAVALEPMGDSMYAACKSGLNTMTNILAKEFQQFGITCNTLAISAIETDMLKQLNKEKIDKVVASLPIPRYATMDDITNVIDFFASERSNYITSQTIYLGGVHK